MVGFLLLPKGVLVRDIAENLLLLLAGRGAGRGAVGEVGVGQGGGEVEGRRGGGEEVEGRSRSATAQGDLCAFPPEVREGWRRRGWRWWRRPASLSLSLALALDLLVGRGEMDDMSLSLPQGEWDGMGWD